MNDLSLELLPPWLFKTYIFLLGALVGSFLNVVIARLPVEGESIVRPRSRCPHCGFMIPWYLNVPVLSWLALRGRCAQCESPISIRYPIVELLTAILFLAVAHRYGPTLACLSGLLLCGSLVAITFIDIDIWEIPDEISLPGILIGILLRPAAFDVDWYDGLAGAAIGGAALWGVRIAFFVLRKVEGMGFGDVKLIAMIGAFLGPMSLLPVILIASISGTVVGVLAIVLGRKGESESLGESESVGESVGESESESGGESLSESGGESVGESLSESEGVGESDAEAEDDEEDWEPPPHAVPFGPFLALGAIGYLLYGDRILALLIGPTSLWRSVLR